ncbi:MAG: transcriptional regulator [Modestobacter sp.]|nr:transcriptional regulator [Modestobacter sp.]
MTVADLAGTRFAVSPLHETITALQLLDQPGRQPLHAPWVRWAERELAADPLELPLLRQLTRHDRPGWPEFLAPAPVSRPAGVREQLASVRGTSPASVRASIRRVFPAELPPAARYLSEEPVRALADAAAELERAHDRLIAPHWPRMRALLDVDITHRARLLTDLGPAALLTGLHPSVRWDDGVLSVAGGGPRHRDVLGSGGLVLCPSVFGDSRVVVKGQTSSQTTLRYPARGTGQLWLRPGSAPPDALVALLGRPRARLLLDLRSPATTTLLAREQGVTASAVSQHLAVLHSGGLVARDRAGRQVHYVATDLGRALLARSASAPSQRAEGLHGGSRTERETAQDRDQRGAHSPPPWSPIRPSGGGPMRNAQ